MAHLKLEPNIFYVTDDYITCADELPKETIKLKHNFKLIVKVSPMTVVGQKTFSKTVRFDSGKTLLQARREIGNIPNELRMKHVMRADEPKPTLTVNDVWDEYVTYKLTSTLTRHWKDGTRVTLCSAYDKWVRDSTLGKMDVDEVRRRDVNVLLEYVGSATNGRDGHGQGSYSVKKNVLAGLKPMYNWYIDKNELDRTNPAAIALPKTQAPKRNIYMSTADAKKLYDAMVNYEVESMRRVFILLWQGRRLKEAVEMPMSDVFVAPEGGVLKAGETYYTIRAERNKANQDMTFRLPDELVLPTADAKWVCPNLQGRNHFSTGTVRIHFIKLLDRVFPDGRFYNVGSAKAEEWKRDEHKTALHIHDTRHIIGGILKRGEVPVEFIGNVLGHSDKQYITNRYTTGAPDTAYRAYRFFIELINGYEGTWLNYTTATK